MTHDEMMNLLANTLADAAGSSGCLPILDCFSPHPGEEVTVSIPMCDDTVDIVLEDLDFPARVGRIVGEQRCRYYGRPC